MNAKSKFSNLLDSETFGEGNNRYFIDLKQTAGHAPYLRITRSENYDSRSQIIIFEPDLHFFVEALSMVLGRLTAGETLSN
jgi:hypothetical protein